ncbi:MAG: MFS transporter, partial [Terriglobus sp.]
LGGIASAGSVYAMELLGGNDTRWPVPVAILVLSLLCGVLAILYARRNEETSLIDFDSMRRKTYSLSIYGASAFRIAVSVLPFLLPLMFQLAFGLNAFRSGMYLLALFGGDLSMKSIVLPILKRYGFRKILIVNGVITALTMVVCAFLSPGTPVVVILLVLFAHGASRSMEFTCLTTLAYSEITPERMSRANGFLSAIMQLSVGMGVAVGAVTLRSIAHARGHSAALPQLADFRWSIVIMAVLALGPVFDSLGLPHDAGADTSGHQVEIAEPESGLI